MSYQYDYLIVGAGLFGAVFAQQKTEQGKKCLVVEKRPHIGGNLYTYLQDGIQVHQYGPHIFHTANREVWNYLNHFAEFNHFRYEPIANYHGQLYNLPFNMNTFHQLWGVNTPAEAEATLNRQRMEVADEPKNLEEQAIRLVGRDVYEKLVKGYTEKQWGRSCRELPAFIIRRLPVRMSYDNNYFNHPYQGIPVGGYTRMIGNLLADIPVRLGVDYLQYRDKLNPLAEKIVYTGPIDAFYGYCYGPLEYRSLRFETEVLDIGNYQGVAGMNFTDSETPYTRIVEHKWFEFGSGNPEKTVITREYSIQWQQGVEPYYPVNDKKNQELYDRYRALVDREENVLFGGRLAEYRYYDMDQVVLSALQNSCSE